MTDITEKYDELQQSLQKLGSDMEPSELHGNLCGLLCAKEDIDLKQWQGSLFPDRDNNDLLVKEIKNQLSELYMHSRQQLNDPVCHFELLLPDDDSATDYQVFALGDWCQGFLIGLTLGGIEDFTALPGDAKEVIKDLVEIARAGTSYGLTGEDEDDDSYVQLVEYVRVGVLLINEELHPNKQSVTKDTILH